MKNKAVFLDRDGVINHDTGFVHKIEDFKFIPGVFEGLKKLQLAGYELIIITNQSGIGRGIYTEEDFLTVNNYMLDVFNKENININKVYFCPHHPDENCKCRKPKTKFIEDAIKEFELDIERCWMIGDRLIDVQLGKRAGCRSVLIELESVKGSNRKKIRNLYEAVEYILKNN